MEDFGMLDLLLLSDSDVALLTQSPFLRSALPPQALSGAPLGHRPP